MSERKYSVLVIAGHPVQYMAPLLRCMAKHPRLDLQVAYCSLRGAEAAIDPDFGTEVKWDVPLLDGYKWTHVPNKGPERETFWGMNNPGLKELIRDGKFDAVVCYTGYVCASFWIAKRASAKAGAAFIFGTDTWTIEPRDGRKWKTWLKKLVWPWIFRMADQAITPSIGGRELMLSLGIPEDRITMTPPCVDVGWWSTEAEKANREAERAKFGLGKEDFVILFCAKLQSWKRPMDLLRAYAQAGIEGSRLIFAGDGPLGEELKTEAARLGVSSQVSFPGFVNQSALPALYKLVDLMVLPSSYEPFAMVVNEAMCCGCPVMASDKVGAARDLIEPIARDFVFPAGDVDTLSRKLLEVALNRARLKNMRESVQRHIQGWSPENNAEALLRAVEAGVRRVRGS